MKDKKKKAIARSEGSDDDDEIFSTSISLKTCKAKDRIFFHHPLCSDQTLLLPSWLAAAEQKSSSTEGSNQLLWL